MNHTCHAQGCKAPVPPRKLMCKQHWNMVPEELRSRVWGTYRPGQERDKNPSMAYIYAAKAAINAVADKESKV